MGGEEKHITSHAPPSDAVAAGPVVLFWLRWEGQGALEAGRFGIAATGAVVVGGVRTYWGRRRFGGGRASGWDGTAVVGGTRLLGRATLWGRTTRRGGRFGDESFGEAAAGFGYHERAVMDWKLESRGREQSAAASHLGFGGNRRPRVSD